MSRGTLPKIMNNKRFEKLLEPSRIGRVEVRNRIVKTATGTASSYDMCGFVNKRHVSMYEALARGGAGLIVVEMGGIDPPLGLHNRYQLLLSDAEHIPGFTEITGIIHKHGGKTFQQLFHAGPWHDPESGLQPISSSSLTADEILGLIPSEVPKSLTAKQLPRGMTIAEIEDIVDKFASTAERARQAGFDGVEVNCGTGHLINSFISRIWNRRQDEYGCQNLENRTRFAVKIINEIKRRLGLDFAVSVLVNVIELGHERATTVDEGKKIARFLQDAGADCIHARANAYSGLPEIIRSEQYFYPEPPDLLIKELDWSRRGAGALVPLAAAIKETVTIPVITVGRLDPVIGEEVLRQGKADFIGMARRLLADPDLPNKIASGKAKDIRPCTACLYCTSRIRTYNPIACQVNAALGKEQSYSIQPAPKQKKVVVVGSGPAGLETARVAAIRGHKVTLLEKGHKLGGLMPLAALVKGHEGDFLEEFIQYYERQLSELGIDVRFGKEVDQVLITQLSPDIVVIASGGIPGVPDIPGIDRRIVVSGPKLHSMLKFYLRFLRPKTLGKLSKLWMPVGRQAVIIGGGLHGCELAEFLVKRGRKITIVESAGTIGEGVPERKKHSLFRWLNKKGVTMIAGVKYEEITDNGLIIRTREGDRKTIEADTIIPAVPLKPDNKLVKNLEGKVPELYAIGDCSQAGVIIDAIDDAYRLANTI
jgi:2,4-dienoyl-CoA reductase (NADPH2)